MEKAREENKQPKSRSELMKEPRKGTTKTRGSDRLGPNSSVVKKSTARTLSPSSQSALNMGRNYSKAYTRELFMAQEQTKDARRVKSEGSGPNSSLVKQSRSGCLSPRSQAALHNGQTRSTKDTERWGKDLNSTNHYTWRVKNNPGFKRHNHSSGVNLSKGPMAKAGEQREKPKPNQWDPPSPTRVTSHRNCSKERGSHSSNVNLCRSGGGHSASRSRDTKTLTERQCRTNGWDHSISLEDKVRKTAWPQERFNRSFGMVPTGASKTGDNKENECRSNTYNQTDCNAQNQSTSKLSPRHGSNRSQWRSLVRTNQTPGENLVRIDRTPGKSLVSANQTTGESGNQPGRSFPCIKIPELTIKNAHEGRGPGSSVMTRPRSRYSPPVSQAAPELKKSGTWNESDVGDVSYLHVDPSGFLSLPDRSQATNCSKRNSDTKVEDWLGEARDRTNLDEWSPIRSNILVPTNGGSNRRCVYYYSPLVEGTRAGQDPDSRRGGDTDKSSKPAPTTLVRILKDV